MIEIFVFYGIIWLNRYAYIQELPMFYPTKAECIAEWKDYGSRSKRHYGRCDLREASEAEYFIRFGL